jgi:hypothetical protein
MINKIPPVLPAEKPFVPPTTAEGWGLRHPGLVMRAGGNNEVREFNGMWGLKPDADPEAMAKVVTEDWFLPTTALLGLIRTARWYILNLTLNGKENLLRVWGQCVGCPEGPDVTAHDITEFIARGQFKTLICYDAYPSISYTQTQKLADWYDKTQKFQRAVAAGGGNLEDKVNAFFSELSKPAKVVPNDVAIDLDARREPQLEGIAENLKAMKAR